MNIKIAGHTRLEEIQQAFASRFPFLKLEFFYDTNKDGKYTANERIIQTQVPVSSVRDSGHDGLFHIDGLMKVADVEKSFTDVFGVYVQVFRKSGNVWLLTTTTDNYSLAELNDLTAEMNEKVETEGEDFENNRDSSRE
ncbi:MAG: hypothetical protein FD123_1413 [Bacteroidetes bacterium]|nr:MAG: hypothetical protein FD123_1413 [Bacteroidota bacterium]